MKKIDLAGQEFSRWTVVSEGEPTKHKIIRWNCMCECGNTALVSGSDLKAGKSKSCGCLRQEVSSSTFKTHGMSKSVEYRHYAGMIDRCRNTNNKHYKDYGARGIEVCDEFTADFMTFFNEIVEKPSSGGRWSVGRIDNNKGYCTGNVRWESDEQQARNHSLQSNNTSGVAGINVRYTERDGDRVVARFNMLDGTRVSKSFSVRKHGLDSAMQLAMKWRKDRIEELNTRGADYAQSHGSKKVFV